MKADQEIVDVYVEEFEEFLSELPGDKTIVRIRKRVAGLLRSSELVGCEEVAVLARDLMASLEASTAIDAYVVEQVRSYSERMVQVGRALASTSGAPFLGEPVQLSLERIDGSARPWWKFW
jgi:hypothetical protein